MIVVYTYALKEDGLPVLED